MAASATGALEAAAPIAADMPTDMHSAAMK
jgi:hypothetical protein